MAALICTKCDRTETQREGNETHCRHCGNVVIDGVGARWPFREQEQKEPPVTPEDTTQGVAVKNLANDSHSPMQLAESIREKEVNIVKKECSHPECVKPSFADSLCYKHYREKHGEYKPKKKRPARTAKDAKRPAPETKRVRGEAKIPKPAAPAPCKKDTGITIEREGPRKEGVPERQLPDPLHDRPVFQDSGTYTFTGISLYGPSGSTRCLGFSMPFSTARKGS